MSIHAALVEVVALVRAGVDAALRDLAAVCADESGAITNSAIDGHQVSGYDLAHLAAQVGEADVIVERAGNSDLDAVLASQYVCDLVDSAVQTAARHGGFTGLPAAVERTRAWRGADWWGDAADQLVASGLGDSGLPDDLRMVAEHFRRFADAEIRPHAAAVHAADGDVPESIISGLAEIGAFGLSVPEQYGGSATGSPLDTLAMVVATEELSTASLALGGSLITRPEILSRGLLAGGTDAQKQRWLPSIASGEKMCTVLVTEPDFGSDVAGVRLRAVADGDHWVLTGRKTWATFAGRGELAMVLARTDPDPAAKHRGLSVFVVEKPACTGHEFRLEQPGGGTMEGVAIPTPGYRGMHSFEVAFDGWRVPTANVVGEAGGVGKGFYLQMQGFQGGRLQTAARAVGLMRAAFDAARAYCVERKVFGKPLAEYELSRHKLVRMAARIEASRQASYRVAPLMEEPDSALEASMLKASVCRSAEAVCREAMQLHGGMGYAEEYDVSRYWIDARVLSIFEGADEVLCLRVVLPDLLRRAHAGN